MESFEYALVERFLMRQGRDAGNRRASLHMTSSVPAALSQSCDPDVQAHVSLVSLPSQDPLDDPQATLNSDVSLAGRGRFRILHPHAKGGLGEVYVAEDTELHRRVALKQIQHSHADRADARARFLLEAEITGSLEHPGIVPVYGLGTQANGQPYYAMRFIHGASLQEAAARFHSGGKPAGGEAARRTCPASALNSVEFRKLLGRFIAVCEAIEYAHSRGVLHRDLKPANIMLGKYGETLVVDWGLAKVKRSSHDETRRDEATLRPTCAGSSPTHIGAALGTPSYMSPEQAAGKVDQLTPASDVYSLGATLYYTLTSRSPFQGNDVGVTLAKVQAGDFPRPREINPHIPQSLQAVCLKAMSLRPEDRYASARELAEDVERWLADEPVTAQSEPASVKARRWLRQRPKTLAAVVATLLVGFTTLSAATAVVAHKNQELAAANHSLQASNAAERLAKEESNNKRIEADRAREDANHKRVEAETARSAESRAKRDALREHEQADAARRRAEDALNFLVWAFRSPDPQCQGRSITMAQVLARSVDDLKDKFNDDPPTKAKLLSAIAQSYQGLGLYQEAVPLFEQVRMLRNASSGVEQAVDALASLSDLAAAYLAAGRTADALPLIEETHRQQREQLGADHPSTLISAKRRGYALYKNGQLAEALACYETVLEQAKASRGLDHCDTITSLNDLATTYLAVGRTAEAVARFEQTLKLQQATLGAEHPNTLIAMNNVAHAYQKAQRQSEALPLFEETLRLRKTRLGLDHPDTLTSMNSLASAYRTANRLAEALPLYEDSLRRTKARLGADHPATLMATNDVAAAYLAVGRTAEALPMLEKTLKLQQTRLGTDHPHTLVSMDNLAQAHLLSRQGAKALSLFEHKLRKAKLGPDHADTLLTASNLAKAQEWTKRAKSQPLRAGKRTR